MWQASSSFVVRTIPWSPAARPSSFPAPMSARRNANSMASVSADDIAAPPLPAPGKTPKSDAIYNGQYHSLVSSPSTPIRAPKDLSLRPSPELGLLSLLFVLFMAIGSVLSLAIVSIPAMSAFRRLATSMSDLSKVVSEEVPGTLSSLKLSGLEISELTQQLSNLRQKISGSKGKRERGSKSSSSRRRNYPFVD
ncbi:uncharacterized protein LOC115693046 isoform X2 [Syzygium oleosum]|uniref:uncharacterized protein LOC115693046 isoform X2 n=1 Tax=Syzygium oleosum TaxID=219896 RepID=UPI0011D21AE8|nr:uncharacterized protein LOC115693046 isoform X2 [Syzygium oleosum]